MRHWMEKISWKMERWMQGRNGQDELTGALNKIALVCILLSCFWGELFMAVAWVCLILGLFRSFSKNIEKRRKERDKYLALIAKPKAFVERQKLRWRDRKTHCYYKCPQCRQTVRVPKGKGNIQITCPKCHNSFQKHT